MESNQRHRYNPHTNEHMTLYKEAKIMRCKKERIFNKLCLDNWLSRGRKMQIDPYLTTCRKLKSKWIKDLSINPTTVNLTEEKVESNIQCISTGDHFLNIKTVAQTLITIISKWDLLKLRRFCKAKYIANKAKGKCT